MPDRETILTDLAARFDRGAGFSIATLNLDHVVKLGRDPAFRTAYAEHTHITADGHPVAWLSRLAGQREVTLVPGSELIGPVAELAARHGMAVGFFGATEASLAAARDALVAQHADLVITYCHAPPMGFDPEGPKADTAIEAIGKSGARVVFLALGAPKQERFAARAQKKLPGVGFLSVGAGLDFVSGAQNRAPSWLRALAGEWLWRMLSDPRRLAPRYGACLAALPGLTARAWAAGRRERDGAA